MNNKTEIFDKIRERKYDEVLEFISNNLDLDYNIKDSAGLYLIFYIVALNKVELVNKILLTNIRTDLYDLNGNTILFIPIKYNYIDIVKVLINYSNSSIGIPLQTLCSENGKTPLHYSILFGRHECIDLLLPTSNVSAVDNNGNSPLHIAVETRNIVLVKKIMSYERNLNIQNNNGETPLHIACRLSLNNIAKYLIDNHADINLREYRLHLAPIHYCCMYGGEYLLNILLNAFADVNMQDHNGYTPLHYCALYDKIILLKTLLTHITTKHKINANLFNISLSTPLHIIFSKSHHNIHDYIALLLPKTNINIQNNLGISCLHELCRTGLWKQYSDTLIAKKMDISLIDYNGLRPIDYVHTSHYDEFIKLVTDSYMFRLQHTKKKWQHKWEDNCGSNIEQCRKNITKKLAKIIDNPKNDCNVRSYPMHQKSLKCTVFSFDERNALNSVTGSSLDILCGMIFLMQQHTNSKIVIGNITHNDIEKCEFLDKTNMYQSNNVWCILEKYFVSWVNNVLNVNSIVDEIIHNAMHDKSKQFIVIFVVITKQNAIGHANILIYSKQTHEFERFDPFGSDNIDDDMLDRELKSYFENVFGKNQFKYIKPSDYMSTVGFQKIDVSESKNEYVGDPVGYCVVWAIWYANMRITNPTLPRQKMIKYIMQQVSEKQLKFRSVIRNFSVHISKIRDNILKMANIDVNQYINDEYNEKTTKIIFDELNKIMSL